MLASVQDARRELLRWRCKCSGQAGSDTEGARSHQRQHRALITAGAGMPLAAALSSQFPWQTGNWADFVLRVLPWPRLGQARVGGWHGVGCRGSFPQLAFVERSKICSCFGRATRTTQRLPVLFLPGLSRLQRIQTQLLGVETSQAAPHALADLSQARLLSATSSGRQDLRTSLEPPGPPSHNVGVRLVQPGAVFPAA